MLILRDKGVHARRVVSAGGELSLSRRYFWAKGKGGVYPADEALGVERDGMVTPGAAQVLCRMGMVGDFAQAAQDAKRIGGVAVSKEKLRQVVEAEAAAVAEARRTGEVPASWSVGDGDAAVQDGPGKGKSRVYAGVDGVMAPAVTQAEKDKRRKQHGVRRQQRSAAGVGNARDLPPARAGSDEKFKEMKVGVIYDQEKVHRHAFATEKGCEGFGPLLKAYAGQVGFERADETISLSDGAKWIVGQVCRALSLSAALLDFYHLAQHVHAAARCCLGETEAARQWASARLAEIKEVGAAPVLAAVEALSKKVRSAAKCKSLTLLREYILTRLERVDYRGALARGWDIGSGPTEAMCKTLTLRLKRPGMRWDADHAAGMMNLVALYESGQADAYWAYRITRKKAA